MTIAEKIHQFYTAHLSDIRLEGTRLLAPCPFCAASQTDSDKSGVLVVLLNPRSFFLGYYRCTRRCRPGGFPLFFARQMGIELAQVPGFDPERDDYLARITYPQRNINAELVKFQGLLQKDQRRPHHRLGISDAVMDELGVGYNGRYWVYPYVMETGDAYAARCVNPGNPTDHFWHGDETCTSGEYRIYNVREFERCEGGALIITLGEANLMILKELGYPAVSVPAIEDLSIFSTNRLAGIATVFILVDHLPEHYAAARRLAARIGFKTRLVRWPDTAEKGTSLAGLAAANQGSVGKVLSARLAAAQVFSPLASPQKEMQRLQQQIHNEKGHRMLGLPTGFDCLDQALDGMRGINILGGPPKTGKSCLVMQLATEMACQRIPVIYYDFENGRQKIYMRTLSRLSSLPEKQIRTGDLSAEQQGILQSVQKRFQDMLTYFRVVTDRQINPDLMRKQIEFLKHETRSARLLVVVDSLHKLPFKDLAERRTGIDSWLRQLEAIRDEHNVAFLVISELIRHPEGGYTAEPTMADFKESGDIEYSADNAMILLPTRHTLTTTLEAPRSAALWIVASRENVPGKVGEYQLEYPYWRFLEMQDSQVPLKPAVQDPQ